MARAAQTEDACPLQGQSVWPWEAEPYRLWGLLDMIRKFSADALGTFLTNLERACAYTELILSPPPVGASRDQLLVVGIPRYRDALEALVNSIANLPISRPVDLQLKRLLGELRENTSAYPDHAAIAAQARQARQALIDDLSQHLFLCVPVADREHYEQPDPPFADAFTGSAGDAKAAGRCLALSEWTACVFHSMRVVEHGLRKLADRFNVPFQTDSWHKVISGIESGIDSLRNKPGLTKAEREEITALSKAATQFRYFKDAWRNHAFHARVSYDERDGRAVYDHVRAFMDALASPPGL